MTQKIPPRLYKYQSYNVQTLDNLKNRCLWFSKPEKFNDPFDCTIVPVIEEMSRDDWQVHFDKFRMKASNKVDFDAKYLQKGRPNDNFKSFTIEESRKTIQKQKNIMLQKRGIVCLSEKVDDNLMWGHYADGHRGFCLEFDTTYEPFSKAFQVIYSDTFPTLNPAGVLVRRNLKQLMSNSITKSSEWSYEKEWRLFHMEGDKKYIIDVAALTGVYFGCAMPFVHEEVIALILAGSPTQLYEMKRSEKEFKAIFEAVDYTAYDYSKKQKGT